MANKHRGEVDIELDGVTYTMRPSFDALSGIEQELNKKIIPLAREAYNLDIGITEAAVIISHGIRGSGGNVSMSLAGKALAEKGLAPYLPIIVQFLGAALGGEEDEEEGKGETEAENEQTTSHGT